MSRQTRHPLLLRTKNMATAYQNLSEYDFNSVPDGSEVTVERNGTSTSPKSYWKAPATHWKNMASKPKTYL